MVDVRGADEVPSGCLKAMKTQLYEPNSSLRVGHVVEVSGNTIKVELDGKITELSRTVDGVIYPIGQIGSTVKIHFGRRIIFGFVTLLRMRSEEEPKAMVPIDADQRVMEVDLFAEASWASSEKMLTYSRGVSLYPLPRQVVYLVTRDEGAMLYRAAEGRFKEGSEPMVPFASYVGSEQTPCRANIDKMFGMHCAILGSTGSGKSGTVAALLHSVLEHMGKEGKPLKPRIVIIDPHGEYGQAFGKRAKVYRAYDPIGIEESTGDPIHLPYWLMSAEEFRSLAIGKTEFEATSQHNIIYKAITHARMVAANLIEPAPNGYGAAWPGDGREISEPRARSGVKPATIAAFDRDKPRPFSLQELENHIRYAQAAREKKGSPVSEQIPEGEFGSKGFRSILDKLSVLRSDPRIRFLIEEYKPGSSPTLTSVIEQFVAELTDKEGNAQDLRIIDISGLPNEVAGPLTAAIARLLFQYKLYQSFKERSRDPILLVCEEAHRYVPDQGEAEYGDAQRAVRRIAREGRKYGLGLMLVSQRPSDIEGTVISQCNTWLVLRLTNHADHQHVARFLPDHLSGMTSALSALGRQEALFVGEGAALPARIKVRTLREDQVPRSNDVQFVEGWTSDKLKSEEIGKIVDRMTSTGVAGAPVAAPTASTPAPVSSPGVSAPSAALVKETAAAKRAPRAKPVAPPPAENPDDNPFA
jgi:hypothetical protein